MRKVNFDSYYDLPEKYRFAYIPGQELGDKNYIPTKEESEALMEELEQLYPDKYGIEAIYRKLTYGCL